MLRLSLRFNDVFAKIRLPKTAGQFAKRKELKSSRGAHYAKSVEQSAESNIKNAKP